MKTLAFDQSKRLTGWAVMEDQKLLAFGKESFTELGQQQLWLEELLAEHQPNIVAIEDIQYQRNVLTFKTLAQVQGLYIGVLENMAISYSVYGSSSWRSIVKLKGQNRTDCKRKAVAMVAEKYGVKATQDEAEAILIATACALENLSAF